MALGPWSGPLAPGQVWQAAETGQHCCTLPLLHNRPEMCHNIDSGNIRNFPKKITSMDIQYIIIKMYHVCTFNLCSKELVEIELRILVCYTSPYESLWSGNKLNVAKTKTNLTLDNLWTWTFLETRNLGCDVFVGDLVLEMKGVSLFNKKCLSKLSKSIKKTMFLMQLYDPVMRQHCFSVIFLFCPKYQL